MMTGKLHVLQGGGQPTKTACGTCRHVRDAHDPYFQKCAAIGSFCSAVRRVRADTREILPCDLWEPPPPPVPRPPRVGPEDIPLRHLHSIAWEYW